MTEYHAVAERDIDGSVTIQKVLGMPSLPHLTYRLNRQLTSTLEVIVWWPERLDPDEETRLVDDFVQGFANQFGLDE